MESSLYENWDVIEMLFGYLVICNFQFPIYNLQLTIGNNQIEMYWQKELSVWGKLECPQNSTNLHQDQNEVV